MAISRRSSASSSSPTDWWRLSVNYSYMQMSLQPLGEDLNRSRFYAGSTPRCTRATSSSATRMSAARSSGASSDG